MISFVESFVGLFAPKIEKVEPKKLHKIRNRVSKNLGSSDYKPKIGTFQWQLEDALLKMRTKSNKINEKLDSINMNGTLTEETGIKLKMEVSLTKLAGVLNASVIKTDCLEKNLFSCHERIAELKAAIITENNEFEVKEANLNLILKGIQSDKLSSTIKDHRLKTENNLLKNQALKYRMELDEVMTKIRLSQQRTEVLDTETSILQEAIANFSIQDVSV